MYDAPFKDKCISQFGTVYIKVLFSYKLIFPSFFPSYLSSSPSDLHTPPFFQSTRREIGSETMDNLSEDNPVKNAYRASAHVLILTLGPFNYSLAFDESPK